jgi:hypothetical protein
MIPYLTIARLHAIAAVAALLASSAFAEPTYNAITVMDGSQSGWREAAIYGASGGLTTEGQVGKGNPGPRPVGFYFMDAGQMGCGGDSGDYPGQCWIGTDRYHTVLLSQITTLKYWTILDYRGSENDPVKDSSNNIVPEEWYPKWFDKQPPQIELFCRVDGNTNSRQFIYRPWSIEGYNGYGPNDGSRCRKWEEWDCLTEGYWLEAIDPPLGEYALMETWDELKNKYPDAYLAMPTWTLTPVWGMQECPVGDEWTCASLNVVLGARKQSWNKFNPEKGWTSWWKESWNAQGAVDKLIVGYMYDDPDPEIPPVLIEDEYDFQSATDATDASANKIRALNNKAVFDQNPYVPNPRTRGATPSVPQPSWGGGTVDDTKMNALQRAGNFNYEQVPGTSDTVGHLFVIYGRVVNSFQNGGWFKVDDGSGAFLDCYCPNVESKVIDDDYVRMVGSLYGQNPYDWFYEMFHMIEWNANPELCKYSHMWPWQFHTYLWNVEVMAR